MRTRIRPSGGHGSTVRPRWPCVHASIAATGSANATKKESPSVFTSQPPHAVHAARRISRWRSSNAGYRSPTRRSNCVDASMSVKTNVTNPDGSVLAAGAPTASGVEGSVDDVEGEGLQVLDGVPIDVRQEHCGSVG